MSESDDSISYVQNRSAWWYKTAQTPKLLDMVDARIMAPMFLLGIRPSFAMAIFVALCVIFLTVLQIFRYSPVAALSALSVIIGTVAFQFPVLRCKDRKGGYL